MPAATEPVALRLLPSGATRAGCLESSEGDRLRIRLEAAGSGLPLGALVEVTGAKMLYLGQIVGTQDPHVVVKVEHSLDRSALAALGNVWNSPKGE